MNSSINLKIYDAQNEIIAEFHEHRIRWGLIEDVVELSEGLEGKNEREAYVAMGQFMQKVFPALTHDLLRQADVADVKTCFNQIVALVQTIGELSEKKQP